MLRVNVNRGGVCIYYRISPTPKIKNNDFLQECINSGIKVKDKLYNLISFHSAHQANLKTIYKHLSNLESNLDSITVNNPPFHNCSS